MRAGTSQTRRILPPLRSKASGKGKRHGGQSHSPHDSLIDGFAIRKETSKVVAN